MEEKQSQISVLVIECAFATQTQFSYGHTPPSLSLLRCAACKACVRPIFRFCVFRPQQHGK